MKDVVYSIGIDLGTSTTQMVISKLTVKNMASAFTIPRIEIIDKEVLYRSDIIFTPLLEQSVIDVESIKNFLDQQYKKSGFTREDIQVGAVIITGETARKDNSSAVLQALSGYAGDFVVATAGPDLESIIAGKGAGAQQYSDDNHTSVANLDIGGGTTNIAVFKEGELLDTACYDIGGRLIKVEEYSNKIQYISPKLIEIIQHENLPIKVGSIASKELLAPIIDILVANLEYAIGIGEKPKYADLLVTNKSLKKAHGISCVSFSGGVADCIETQEESSYFTYGDIGIFLGQAIQKSKIMKEKKVIASTETIRATVVGAGSHTTKVSGSTITYSTEILPMKNIPVLKLTKDDEDQVWPNLAEIIIEKLKWYRVEEESQIVALGLEGIKNPTFDQILNLGKAITKGYQNEILKGNPIVVLLKEDNGKSLGQSIFSLVPEGSPIVCLDGLSVENGDYIDIGMPIAGGTVLPVIVKTLVFE